MIGICIDCKQETELAPSQNRRLDGSNDWCISCKRLRRNAAYKKYRQNNTELLAAKARIRNALPEVIASRQRYMETYELRRIASVRRREVEIAERTRLWAAANKDKRAAATKRYRKRRPDMARLQRQVRYARKRAAGPTISTALWRDICKLYGNVCLRCGLDKPLTIDHITPVSLGGTNDLDNLQPLCGSCNSWKRQRVIDFRQARFNPVAGYTVGDKA